MNSVDTLLAGPLQAAILSVLPEGHTLSTLNGTLHHLHDETAKDAGSVDLTEIERLLSEAEAGLPGYSLHLWVILMPDNEILGELFTAPAGVIPAERSLIWTIGAETVKLRRFQMNKTKHIEFGCLSDVLTAAAQPDLVLEQIMGEDAAPWRALLDAAGYRVIWEPEEKTSYYLDRLELEAA